MIDHVAIDFSRVEELPLQDLPLVSAQTKDGGDCIGSISQSDSSYVCVMPGNHIEVVFVGKGLPENQRVYVVAAQGFLYEWLSGAGATWPIEDDGEDRVATLALLLKERNLLLSRVYREWSRHSISSP